MSCGWVLDEGRGYQMNAAVALSDVTAGYGRNIVFSGLSLEIPMGQFAGIVGPTGCGKTTLLKTILGTQPVFTGNVHLNGRPSPARRSAPSVMCLSWEALTGISRLRWKKSS